LNQWLRVVVVADAYGMLLAHVALVRWSGIG
jgi:hypothetical protein